MSFRPEEDLDPMNAFDVCTACVPGDMLVMESSDDNLPVLFQKPKLGRLLSRDGDVDTRTVPNGSLALVILRKEDYIDWVFVLCDNALGWINALSVMGKVKSPTVHTVG